MEVYHRSPYSEILYFLVGVQCRVWVDETSDIPPGSLSSKGDPILKTLKEFTMELTHTSINYHIAVIQEYVAHALEYGQQDAMYEYTITIENIYESMTSTEYDNWYNLLKAQLEDAGFIPHPTAVSYEYKRKEYLDNCRETVEAKTLGEAFAHLIK